MRVTSRGWSISYSVAGSGPGVLLVPGFSQWAGQWAEAGYVDALSQRYRVVVVDPLGHGDSDKPHVVDAYRPRELVTDLVAVLNDAGVDTVSAWGYSMGVQHVTDLASVEPSRVRSVVCGSGNLRGDEAEIIETAKIMSTRLREQGGLEDWWAEIGWVDTDRVASGLSHNDAEALACFWEARPGWRPERIPTAPALAYWGSGEDVPDGTTDVLDALGVEHHELRDANHATCFQRSSEVLTWVSPFLDRTSRLAPTA